MQSSTQLDSAKDRSQDSSITVTQLFKQKGGCGQGWGFSKQQGREGCDQTGSFARVTVMTESKTDKKGSGE